MGHTDPSAAIDRPITRAISPVPTDEEAVAIVAAVEALWPRPVVVGQHEPDRTVAWRFSGRWWHRDRFARVDRPWT